MQRSTERILTTHTGSLARPAALQAMLLAKIAGQAVDAAEYDAACRDAVRGVVEQQARIGIAVLNDGDQSRTGFAAYVRERLHGFDGPSEPRMQSLEAREFPEYYGSRAQHVQPCSGPLSWRDFAAVEKDIEHLQAATRGVAASEVFMTSLSPGSFANHNPNRYYPSREAYLTAIADVMKREYDAIARAGFILQLDSPDLAQRSHNFPDLSVAEFRARVAENIAALNHATRDVPVEQCRVHVCWGANAGPHLYDTELTDIVDLLLTARPAGLSIVAANGRHQHEWRVWQDVRVPEGKVIIPGVIDSTANIVEHPATVAERIVRFAEVLGRENVIAGVDCGFGTIVAAGAPQVDARIAWRKLQALVEGAALASQRLWN